MNGLDLKSAGAKSYVGVQVHLPHHTAIRMELIEQIEPPPFWLRAKHPSDTVHAAGDALAYLVAGTISISIARAFLKLFMPSSEPL